MAKTKKIGKHQGSKQGKHQAPPVLLPARPPTREEEEEAVEGDHNGGDEFAEGPRDAAAEAPPSSPSRHRSPAVKAPPKKMRKAVNFPKDKEDEAIDWYKEHMCLYDRLDKDWKNVMKKEELWQGMARYLNVERDTLFNFLHHQRDIYVKERKPKPSGSAYKQPTPCVQWVLERFNFLEGHIHEQPTRQAVHIKKKLGLPAAASGATSKTTPSTDSTTTATTDTEQEAAEDPLSVAAIRKRLLRSENAYVQYHVQLYENTLLQLQGDDQLFRDFTHHVANEGLRYVGRLHEHQRNQERQQRQPVDAFHPPPPPLQSSMYWPPALSSSGSMFGQAPPNIEHLRYQEQFGSGVYWGTHASPQHHYHSAHNPPQNSFMAPPPPPPPMMSTPTKPTTTVSQGQPTSRGSEQLDAPQTTLLAELQNTSFNIDQLVADDSILQSISTTPSSNN